MCEARQYPTEACDVRYAYSTMFPFPASPNIAKRWLSRADSRAVDRSGSGSAIPSRVPWVWKKVAHVHSWAQSVGSGSELGLHPGVAGCGYRKLLCAHCQRVRIEELELFHPYFRVTQRLAQYIHELCKVMTVQEVAQHFGLDWKTVKDIDKLFWNGTTANRTSKGFADPGHRRDLDPQGAPIPDGGPGLPDWPGGLDRKKSQSQNLEPFFNQMTPNQRRSLEAIVMDMWDPYIKAVQKKVPHVKIVFDLFHVVARSTG